MPLWIYELPNWQLGVIAAVGLMALALGGHAVFQHFCRTIFPESDRNQAIALMTVIATMNSLLLAFSAVSVWDAFGTADRAVSGEATTIGELSRDLRAFGSPQSRQADARLAAYARAVVDQEWPAMQQGGESAATWTDFELMFDAVATLDPVAPREMALMPEIWARANEAVKYRRARLEASKGRVPDTLWIVVSIGTLLTFIPAFVLPRRTFNRVGIAMLALSMGLVLFFIAALDRPFVGKESVSPEPFVLFLRDAAEAPAGSSARH